MSHRPASSDPSGSRPAGRHVDERTRAATIDSYDLEAIRDSEALHQIVDFAGALLDAPTATITIVEDIRQMFLVRRNLAVDETPREQSFCAHAMLGCDVMVVPDARLDPRFAENPLVTGEMGLRFYAGAPLVSDDGVPLGALCVIDTEPHDGLTPLQRQGLQTLAACVMMRLRSNRESAASRAVEDDARRAALDSELRFRTIADTMPQMVWSTLPDGYHDYYNARWYEFTGMPEGSTDGAGWNGMFHAEDRERAWQVWRHCLATGEPYQIEYRLRRADGSYRWVLGRALPIRDAAGRITRWFGTCTDIHEQKLALEEREVISQELSHRIKNIFAVISGLIALAARARPELTAMAADLRERINALGRAHDFVRPHSIASRPARSPDSLHGLLEDLFAPYRRPGVAAIAVTGADLRIDDRSATPLALLFHELATNASKYGALSTAEGRVALAIAGGGDAPVTLRWRETGGPAVNAPATAGFGSQLIELSAVRQLGGHVERTWHRDGLEVAITLPASALAR